MPATVLLGEVAALGDERTYQTFTRQLRDRALRRHCEPCGSTYGAPMWKSSISF